MATDDADFERFLRQPALRRPGAGLDARVAAATARRSWHVARWAVAASLVLAAGTATWFEARRERIVVPVSVATVPTLVERPLRIERETSRTIDDGIVSVTGNVPYAQLRRQTVREVWWIDPATHARLQVSIPSEQVVVERAETF